jgi:hypothetical protein
VCTKSRDAELLCGYLEEVAEIRRSVPDERDFENYVNSHECQQELVSTQFGYFEGASRVSGDEFRRVAPGLLAFFPVAKLNLDAKNRKGETHTSTAVRGSCKVRKGEDRKNWWKTHRYQALFTLKVVDLQHRQGLTDRPVERRKPVLNVRTEYPGGKELDPDTWRALSGKGFSSDFEAWFSELDSKQFRA